MMQSLLVFVFLLGITSAPAYLEGAAYPLADQDMSTIAFITNKDSNDVVAIDTRTNQPITRFVCGPWCNPHMSMLTHDGKKLLVPGTKRNELMIFDVATGELTASLAVGMSPEHFDVSPDSKLAYIANFEGGTISAIDLTRNVEVARIEGFSEPHGVSFLPDGSKTYIANFGAHEVGVVDTKTHQLIKRIAVGSAYKVAALNPDRYLTEIKGIANVTLTPDGRFGYAADGDSGEVAVIDTATDNVVTTILVGKEPWRAYSSPDGRFMLVPNNGEGTISVISTESNKVVATLRCGGGMTGVNFVNGGKKAYAISSEEGAVYVYDMTGFKESKRLKIGSQIQLETASTTPDGSKVYLTCSTTNSVYAIDGSTDKVSTIPNVGQSPWAVTILGGYNYCH
ncbi:MAG: beta-propeller fold lactonase family protein [Candidatus Brocadiales bacterium]|nr:beta-propeller fold lactonase family protein [Candidatus Brocadiales bacterium]